MPNLAAWSLRELSEISSFSITFASFFFISFLVFGVNILLFVKCSIGCSGSLESELSFFLPIKWGGILWNYFSRLIILFMMLTLDCSATSYSLICEDSGLIWYPVFFLPSGPNLLNFDFPYSCWLPLLIDTTPFEIVFQVLCGSSA